MFQETRFQDQVLKPCKFFQESSEEVLSFKTRQLAQQLVSIEVQKAISARCSTVISINRVFIEVYEILFFRTDFTLIREQMFGLSFLTTLNIYKDCFKGRYSLCNLMQKNFTSIL